MPKFQMQVTVSEDAVVSARFGAAAGSANWFTDTEVGKAVKYVADSRFDLCAAGDPIEGFVTSVESAPLDGFSVGSMQVEDRREVTLDGLQTTPGTGTVLVGDYVVCGTVTARLTALTNYRQKVCKATNQPGAAPADLANAGLMIRNAVYAWRVVSITTGTGAVGDIAVIERVNR